jgi:hypothetical protein
MERPIAEVGTCNRMANGEHGRKSFGYSFGAVAIPWPICFDNRFDNSWYQRC